MNWKPAVAMAVNTVVIVIHVLALTLLVVLKQNNLKGSQKLLLIALSVTELTYALMDNVAVLSL